MLSEVTHFMAFCEARWRESRRIGGNQTQVGRVIDIRGMTIAIGLSCPLTCLLLHLFFDVDLKIPPSAHTSLKFIYLSNILCFSCDGMGSMKQGSPFYWSSTSSCGLKTPMVQKSQKVISGPIKMTTKYNSTENRRFFYSDLTKPSTKQ